VIYPRATDGCLCATCEWLRKTETGAYDSAKRSDSLLERLSVARDKAANLGPPLPMTPTSAALTSRETETKT
jgi:hypothetical protein